MNQMISSACLRDLKEQTDTIQKKKLILQYEISTEHAHQSDIQNQTMKAHILWHFWRIYEKINKRIE